MIRKEVKELVNFGIPDSWNEFNENEMKIFDSLLDKVFHIDPLGNDEALYLAKNLGKSDLNGIGTSICGMLQRAPNWPVIDYLYIDNFSDSIMELKNEIVSYGELDYAFTSIANKGLILSGLSSIEDFLKIKPSISVLDLQFIISVYWGIYPENIEPRVVNHLIPTIQCSIFENKITRDRFDGEYSLSLSALKEKFNTIVSD